MQNNTQAAVAPAALAPRPTFTPGPVSAGRDPYNSTATAPRVQHCVPAADDPLATTIRMALDARRLGIEVEEHQLPQVVA